MWQIGKSPGGRADPAGQGRGRKAHALTGEDFGRAVKWQAIVVLLDEVCVSKPAPAQPRTIA